MNADYTKEIEAFTHWLSLNYKSGVGQRIYAAMTAVNAFLRETNAYKTHILAIPANVASQLIERLRQNRIFKFQYRDMVPNLEMLAKAIRSYAKEQSNIQSSDEEMTDVKNIATINKVNGVEGISNNEPIAEKVGFTELFKAWIFDKHSKDEAEHILRVLDCAESYMRETKELESASSICEHSVSEICEILGSLYLNRVFKFRFRIEVQRIPNLLKLLRAFEKEQFDGEEEISNRLLTSSKETDLEGSADNAEKNEAAESESASKASISDGLEICQTAGDEEACGRIRDNVENSSFEVDENELTYDNSPISIADLSAETAMQRIFDRCTICLEGKPVSKGELQKKLFSFMAQTTGKDIRNVGMVLHGGSIVLKVVAIMYAAILNIIENRETPESIVRKLSPGDGVLIIRNEIVENRTVISINKDSTGVELLHVEHGKEKRSLPSKMWNSVIPYNGNSKQAGGQGIRVNWGVRESFFKDVLGIESIDVPSVLDTSTVIVMPKAEIDFIKKNLSVAWNSGSASFLDVITASYYTDTAVQHFSGNLGKNEPVMKFTSKVSVARSLAAKRTGNRCTGVLVFDDEIIEKSKTELPGLLRVRGLKYAYIFASLDSEAAPDLLENNKEAALFACTKEFLETCKRKDVDNRYTREMYKQIRTILNHKNSYKLLTGPISAAERREFYEAIGVVRSSYYEINSKDDFIACSWALMRLLETAVFSLFKMNSMAERETIPVESTSARLQFLKETAQQFPGELEASANRIIDILESGCNRLTEHNEKEYALYDLIKENRKQRLCIVVPKAYHIRVLEKSNIRLCVTDPSKLTICTANGFNRSITYDKIIVAGDYTGKRFNALKCSSADEIITLLYQSEYYSYRRRVKAARAQYNNYNERATFKFKYKRELIEEEVEDRIVTDVDAGAVEEVVKDLDQYIMELEARSLWLNVPSGLSGRRELADVEAVVKFESGERAYLTKYYHAYVLDTENGKVNEKVPVSKLADGDSIVFTRADDATRDIADDVLQMLLDSGKLREETKMYFEISRSWKSAMWDYMEKKTLTSGKLATKLKDAGISVGRQTIIAWMNPYTRTICPNDSENIRIIGIVTENEFLSDAHSMVYSACSRIKAMRREILKNIAAQIIRKINGETRPDNPIEGVIYDRIESLADVLVIESIHPVEKSIPANYTNRPISKQ